MHLLNAVLRSVFDALLYPFRALPALVGLTVVSIVTAVVMLVVFKATSNQAAIEKVKRKIHAGLFEIRLFNDDFRAILGAQGEILRHNLSYLRLSLLPMLFILPPLVLVVAQLQFHYGYAPLPPEQATLLEVRLAEGWEERGVPTVGDSGKPRAVLETPAGVRVETPAVWSAAPRTLTWRLAVLEPGRQELTVVVGGDRASKTLEAGRGVLRRSPRRPDRSFLEQLIYPAEAPLPAASAIESIELRLPAATVGVLGWEVAAMAGVPAWMIVFFVLSIVFAFALRKPMGVQI